MTPTTPPGTELVRPGGVRVGDRLLVEPGIWPWWQPAHRWHGRTLAWSTRSVTGTLTTVRGTDQYTDFYTTGATTVMLLLTDHGLIVTTPTNALLRTTADPAAAISTTPSTATPRRTAKPGPTGPDGSGHPGRIDKNQCARCRARCPESGSDGSTRGCRRRIGLVARPAARDLTPVPAGVPRSARRGCVRGAHRRELIPATDNHASRRAARQMARRSASPGRPSDRARIGAVRSFKPVGLRAGRVLVRVIGVRTQGSRQ